MQATHMELWPVILRVVEDKELVVKPVVMVLMEKLAVMVATEINAVMVYIVIMMENMPWVL